MRRRAARLFLAQERIRGANNLAFALIGFENLAAYENYRGKLLADPEAQENFAAANEARCILIEERSYFERLGEDRHPL